jgi:N-acetylglucosaminyldiphosphoundecaprenol N-acetyl-beta-D-mannosaminyltransferase
MWHINSMQTNERGRQMILEVPVDPVLLPEALGVITGWLENPTLPAPHPDAETGERLATASPPSPRGGWGLHHVVTVNPEFVIVARRDARFAAVLRESALATADGIGIVLAGRVLGVPVPGRVTGVDLVEGLAGLGHAGCRLFLLGAGPGVAEEAASRLRDRFPGARIAGTFAGSPDDASFPEIAERLGEAQASVLLVAFGHPVQDLWISRHRDALATHGILVGIGVGGVFDYLSGRVPRAPRLLRRLGLEWLYRLIRQPWRWRRQLALPLFALLVVRERIRLLLDGRGRERRP